MNFINEAAWDRIARIALGVLMLGLSWGGVIEGTLGTVFQYLGFVPLATGLLGWCPLYAIFRFRTNADTGQAVKAAR